MFCTPIRACSGRGVRHGLAFDLVPDVKLLYQTGTEVPRTKQYHPFPSEQDL